MNINRRKIILIASILLSIFLLLSIITINEHAHYKSPYGNFSLSVYRVPLPFSPIGGGSDAPGFMILFNKHGIPIRACSLDMVQNISTPKWSNDKVYMKLIIYWNLK